jgi:serine/threonine protein kinase
MENPLTKRFGRYEVVGELGRGAMGIVYKARDPQIDRIVALKTISLRGQEPEAEEEFRKRFLNEAQAAGRLHHHGIVSIFDVGEDPDTRDPYIVLEYVAGEALNRVLARERKLPLEQALQLALEIAEALDYAHGQGVTHRDIKPGNILITKDGKAKISDFGIAKLNLAHITLPGKVLGTPAYMAPEQLSGEGADGRSDLFSLGVILYAMATGYSPFQGDSATTVCFKVANREPVPASAMDLTLPRDLDEVINKAMAKEPVKRYQRGSEFAEALRQLQEYRHPSSTATLQAIQAAEMSRDTRRTSGAPAGFLHAAKTLQAAVMKAPIRDLALGAGTIVLLVIVGVQSKLLVNTHEDAADVGIRAQQIPGVQNSSAQNSDSLSLGSQNSGAPTSAVQAPGTKAIQPAPANSMPARDAATARSATDKATVQKASTKSSGNSSKTGSASRTTREIVVPLSNVELAIRHQFKEATLTVWVDDKLTLTRELHGGTQKRLVVFSGVRGTESETLKVPAGKHVLRFRAQTADQTVDLSKTLAADLIGGNDKTLLITFEKHNSVMKLEWQ